MVWLLLVVPWWVAAGPEGDMDKLASALSAISDGSAPAARLTGAYADGNGLDGWTTLTLEAGQVHLKRTHPGQPDEVFAGALRDAEARELAGRAVANKIWTVVSTRAHGVPDETRPKITLGIKDVGDFSVQLWDNEADKVPAFATTRSALLAIASRVSDGQVTY